MPVKRTRHGAEFKAKVALEAIKGQKTANEISSLYGIHANQILRWKKQAIDELKGVFSGSVKKTHQSEEEIKGKLYQEIGQLKMELDWLKKKSGLLP